MRIKRAIIIPAILTLGTAGSVLAGSAVSVAAAQRPAPRGGGGLPRNPLVHHG